MKKLLKSYETLALVKFTKAEVKNIKKMLKKEKNIILASKIEYDIFGDVISYMLINNKLKVNNCNLFTKFEITCNKEKFIKYVNKMENTILVSVSEKFIILEDFKNTFYFNK